MYVKMTAVHSITTTAKRARLAFLPLCLLLFASCAVEESETPVITDRRVPVVFSAPPVAPATRTSVDGNQWVGGDRIGIYMLRAGGALPADIAENADNRRYVVSSITGGSVASFVPVDVATDLIQYPSSPASVDFVACYPYKATGSGGIDGNGYYPIDVSNQNNPAAIDLMYAKVTGVNKSTNAVSLPFEHVMTRLVLNVARGTDIIYSDSADIIATVSGMPVKAKFSLSDRQFVPEGAVSFRMRKVATAAGYLATFEAVVIPTAGGDRRVTLRFYNNEYVWKIPAADAFLPGKRYIHTMTAGLS
ncbi:MAG: fimbrillin family protein [Tannerella sp.]|nr:fimbrillin family protein [Tannerella sp.]